MFSFQSLIIEICRDHNISMKTEISHNKTDNFQTAVDEILKTKDLSFPGQVFFKGQGQLYIYFNSGLQGYMCVFLQTVQPPHQLLQDNGKAAYLAPQFKISAAVSAVKINRKSAKNFTPSPSQTLCKRLRICLQNDCPWQSCQLAVFIMENSTLTTGYGVPEH